MSWKGQSGQLQNIASLDCSVGVWIPVYIDPILLGAGCLIWLCELVAVTLSDPTRPSGVPDPFNLPAAVDTRAQLLLFAPTGLAAAVVQELALEFIYPVIGVTAVTVLVFSLVSGSLFLAKVLGCCLALVSRSRFLALAGVWLLTSELVVEYPSLRQGLTSQPSPVIQNRNCSHTVVSAVFCMDFTMDEEEAPFYWVPKPRPKGGTGMLGLQTGAGAGLWADTSVPEPSEGSTKRR